MTTNKAKLQKLVRAFRSLKSRVDSLLYSPALPSRLMPCCQPLALLERAPQQAEKYPINLKYEIIECNG